MFGKLFDVRSLIPRARRRISPRETAKGVLASARLTEAEAGKRAQRRVHRQAMTKAVVDGLRENPAGSKLLRRFAKSAGFVVQDSDGRVDFVRRPTALECRRWYRERVESSVRVGHRVRSAA